MNRAELARHFAMSSTTQLKTFVLEAHADGEPYAFLTDLAGTSAHGVSSTDDIYLHELREGDLHFVVDHLDQRFWSFHTEAPSAEAFRFLRSRVEARRDLDWTWLPSAHLRHIWPGSTPQYMRSDFRGGRLLPLGERVRDLQVEVRGRDADALVAHIRGGEGYGGAIAFDRVFVTADEPAYGVVQEAVNRRGRFVATGSSFELHQAVVRGVVNRYRQLIEAIEGRALSWAELPTGGGAMTGGPIDIVFHHPIPDLALFIDELLSSREPFRLWGVAEELGADAYGVEAVDLHVGQTMRLDITPHSIRVYLNDGGCGNSVARLAANLQHRFDGALRLADPHLELALAAGSVADT